MPMFVYEAKNMEGLLLKGKMEAADEKALVRALREKTFYPIKIKPYKASLNVDLNDLKKVSIKDISIFCRQFAIIISSGISIVKATEIIKEQTQNPKFKKILLTVNEEIQKGKALSIAFREHDDIPDMLINIIEVGEASGKLDEMMNMMAVYYEKEYKQQQKIKQATTYPKVISVFALIVVTGMVTFIVPTFAEMLKSGGGVLPVPTQIILGISDFARSKGLIVAPIIVCIILLLKFTGNKGKTTLKSDKYKIKLPIFGKLYIKIITARFARTFGILMSSGIPIMTSIEICSRVLSSKTFGDILINLKDEVKKGAGIGDTLSNTKMFPPMLTQMIKIGEESGNLDEVLANTAGFYDDEVELATAQMTTLIEPVIIVLLAVVVGFIVLAIILPMFSLYDVAGK
jgi:type IV pilus assembly protein PilC